MNVEAISSGVMSTIMMSGSEWVGNTLGIDINFKGCNLRGILWYFIGWG